MNSLLSTLRMYGYQQCVWEDDFQYTLPSTWTDVATDSGTATIGIATLTTGAKVLVPSDGTVADNDEIYSYGPKLITLKQSAAFAMVTILKYTEANTDDANIGIGLSKTAPAANFLVDDGGGISNNANYDGFYFEKIDGTLAWKSLTQWSGTSFSNRSVSRTSPVFSGRQALIIEVRCSPNSGNLFAEVTYKVAYIESGGTPEPLTVTTGLVPLTVRDRPTFSGTTDLMPVLTAKNGSANNESIAVDYVGLFQIRA